MPPTVHSGDMETKTGSLGDAMRTDSSDDAISRQVIEAVADAKGVDPLDLPPLYDDIDPDALDGLFRVAGSSASITSLRFEIADCEVLVRGSGDVVVVQSESDVDAFEAESRTVQDTSRDSVEDRCGVDIGANGRRDTHYA